MAVKETKEALRALITVGVVAREVGADGWEITGDGALMIRNDKLQDALATGLEGATKITGELSHLTFADTIDLVSTLAEAAKMFEPKPTT